ncbi:S-layer homology domain-containing protein [Paenibacillus planticolens]|uniref:S-layer family protein n=1 Tax=Paenibacillus planticolens TaxID=2654976 RepID=A0ABX1ZLS8_9BACL|nr:S-layer homology domain-containing protein [Paenibacillus planticolens]NOV01022.1 hypothetical protein [Paenibacillus planticolens]
MLHSTKKALAAIQVLSMLFSSASLGVGAAAAETPSAVGVTTDAAAVSTSFLDVARHWASNEINRWSQKGLIQGYEDATFKPDASISRSEFVSLVSRVFGYTDRANRSFPDVKVGAWYADDVSKAVEAGIVSGDDQGNFRPEAPISRQEAAVILSRAFDLKAKDSKISDRFTDAGLIASWSKEAVNALLEGGFVSGRENGAFDPQADITRAEFVKMIDAIVGELKNEAKTYTGHVSSNLVINTKDVKLKDMVIEGNLYIAQGVGDGNMSMENVTVKGQTIVRGGGEHSILISKSTLVGPLMVLKKDGKVRIVLDGNFTGISVEAPGATVQLLNGTVDQIEIQSKASLELLGGKVANVHIQKWAGGTTVQLGANAAVTNFKADAQVEVKGSGSIENAIINADGVKMEPKPSHVTIADGVKTDVTAPTSAGGGTSAGGTSGGGSSDGGSSGGEQAGKTAAQVAAAITAIEAPAMDGTDLMLPAVPAGFTVAIKISSNTDVIALNGTIVPPSAETTVNIVLEITRTSDNTKASTTGIAVVVPEKSSVTAAATDIQIKNQGYNYVSDISKDVISVTSGNTYMYTVDTAEGAGLTTLAIKTVGELLGQITSKTSASQTYAVKDGSGTKQLADPIAQGDILTVTAGEESHNYTVNVIKGALRGEMQLENSVITAKTQSDVVLNFFAGMRSPATEVVLKVPKGIGATLDNTSVNVIGRGKVKLSGLETQSIGRVGAGYRFQKVGTVAITDNLDGSQFITFKGLDLRPANGADLQITFEGVAVDAGSYQFEASYKTSEPEVLTSPWGSVSLQAVNTISNFNRVLDKSLTYKETAEAYTKAKFTWSAAKNATSIKLMESTNKGVTWAEIQTAISIQGNEVEVANLTPDSEYYFKLVVNGGENSGDSNVAKFYTGKFNAKLLGAKGNGTADDTQAINDAIVYLNSLGGGTLLFENGTFNVRTVQLQSNVYLYIHSNATISALKGGDAPETTYFSDKAYRAGTSATDTGPYKDPENYMTKQDVGHTYFRNAMFFGERLDNIKIIGNGRITGNGNLTTSDGVMNNAADNRTDKMVTVKLCTNFEFGGLDNGLDLWYQETNSPATDQPYYIQSINEDGTNEVKNTDISNMLRVDKAGHFAMLATGTDHINTHDFYYGKDASGSARDVFDYMQSSFVTAKNIYVRGSSDDIVKPGSDSSLGFTRPATTYYVRNIIGDTNCNLFQIGSETVDDIKNLYVDNIYVLAGNKAGFSISTNDGAHVENVYLNYGHTGTVHHTAQMRRTRAPFFISISNRGRVIGGSATKMKWMENGTQRDELLSTNVNIGVVKNIYIKDVNIEQVYGGSQYNDPSKRWAAYTNQSKAAPIIAGYKVGDGGPVLPDGRNIGYIENLNFENVDVLVKGGNSFADTLKSPPELGVGKYNIGDIGEQPSYGFWAKHVKGLSFKNVTTNFEQNDDRFAIVLDDVSNAILDTVKMVSGSGNPNVLQLRNASDITVTNSSYYKNTWGSALTSLADISHVTVSGNQTYPNQTVVNLQNTEIQLKLSGHANLSALDTATSTITAILGSTVSDLISQVESTNGTTQSYAVKDSSNNAKSSGQLVTGDVLVVTSQDETATKNYQISVPNVITVEGESQVTTAAKSAGVTLSTSSTNGINYLQTSAVAVGGYVELTVNVPTAGMYDLSYQYKTNTTGRATVQVSLDGTDIGSPTNQNGATANVFVPVVLGNVTLTKGIHTVRFTATAAGSIVIDYVRLTGATATPQLSTNTNIQYAASHPNVTAVDSVAHVVNVTNGATVDQVKLQVTSSDSSTQTYAVTDSSSLAKNAGALVTGDILVVTAADGTTTAQYTINVAAAVLSSNTNIQLAASHANVAAVDLSSLRVGVSGTTTTVAQLTAQLASTDGSIQTYTVNNAGGTAQAAGQALANNVYTLIVKAEDGTTTASYKIMVGALAANAYVQPKAADHPNVIAIYHADMFIMAKTGITAANLLAEIESVDATKPTYTVIDAVYATGSLTGSAVLYSGDQLQVTSQDGTVVKTYTIKLVDVVYDIDPTGTYPITGSLSGKQTATDDTAGSYVRNGAVSGTHLQYTFPLNGSIQFTVIAPSDGNYDVLFGYKKNTGRATLQLSIDGTSVGAPVNELLVGTPTPPQGMYASAFANVHLSAGSHTFTFTSTVAGSASFDFISLTKIN